MIPLSVELKVNFRDRYFEISGFAEIRRSAGTAAQLDAVRQSAASNV